MTAEQFNCWDYYGENCLQILRLITFLIGGLVQYRSDFESDRVRRIHNCGRID
jgi:hypothetical protein